jgi:hypothetical protein
MGRRQWPPEVAHLPVCPHRDLPVPFIAETGPDGTGHFTILDDARARQCLKYRLCAMCGRPMGRLVSLIGDVVSLHPDGFFIEPPVHERCGELAFAGLCPFLSRERVPRRPPEDGVAVVGMLPGELAGIGREVAKRPLIMAVTPRYRVLWVPSHAGSPVMAYQAGPVERVRRFGYGPDGRLAEATRAAAPPCAVPAPAGGPRGVRVQPRRRPRSKR